MQFIIFIFVVFFSNFSLKADDYNYFSSSNQLSSTNIQSHKLYITDNGSIFYGSGTNQFIDPTLVSQAKTNPESWSAKEFPGGNWGDVEDGGQVSLRFDKRVYTNQEPIHPVVLVRNMTNRPIVFFMTEDVAPGNICFRVCAPSGQPLVPKPKNSVFMSPSAGLVNIIRPSLQRKYDDVLNRTYDLTNGVYLVQASIKLADLNERAGAIKSESREVKSAAVRIEIR